MERAKIRSIGGGVKKYEVDDKVICWNFSDYSSKLIPTWSNYSKAISSDLFKCGGDIDWNWHINQIIDWLDKHELTIPEIVNGNTLITPYSETDNFKLIENNVSKNMTNKSFGIKLGIIDS